MPQDASRAEATAKLCELIVMEELANLAAAAAAAAASLTRETEAVEGDEDGSAACRPGTGLNDAHLNTCMTAELL